MLICCMPATGDRARRQHFKSKKAGVSTRPLRSRSTFLVAARVAGRKAPVALIGEAFVRSAPDRSSLAVSGRAGCDRRFVEVGLARRARRGRAMPRGGGSRSDGAEGEHSGNTEKSEASEDRTHRVSPFECSCRPCAL